MPVVQLTIEQQFTLETWGRSIDNADPEVLREMALELIRQSMIKDNVIRDLIKRHGI